MKASIASKSEQKKYHIKYAKEKNIIISVEKYKRNYQEHDAFSIQLAPCILNKDKCALVYVSCVNVQIVSILPRKKTHTQPTNIHEKRENNKRKKEY